MPLPELRTFCLWNFLAVHTNASTEFDLERTGLDTWRYNLICSVRYPACSLRFVWEGVSIASPKAFTWVSIIFFSKGTNRSPSLSSALPH